MDDAQLPMQGVTSADVDNDPRPLEDAPEPDHTLLDLAEHFVYFTPALMMVHGHFDRDPVADFVVAKQIPVDAGLAAFDHQTPLFSGLGRTLMGGQMIPWDNRIYMIPRELWDDCCGYISSIVIKDNPRQQYTTFGWYSLPVVDPTTMRSGRVLDHLPFITVQVLAASSNRGFLYLEPAADPPRTKPTLVRESPRGDVVAQSICVLAPPEKK